MNKEQRIEEMADTIFPPAPLEDMRHWQLRIAHQINALFPQGDDEGLLKDEEIIEARNKGEGELWSKPVTTGTERILHPLRSIAKTQRDLTTRLIKQEKPNRETKCDHVFERTALYERHCVDCGLEQIRDIDGTIWREKS